MKYLLSQGVHVKYVNLASVSYLFFILDYHKVHSKLQKKMEAQPNEILVHIFKQIIQLKDITKCYKSNLRWRQILEEMFKNNCKCMLNLSKNK